MNTGSGYTDAEIVSIEQWLKEGLSALKIAAEFSAVHGRAVSRNAIIGIVHRNKVLNKIGLAGPKAGRSGGRPKKAKPEGRAWKPSPYQLPGRIHAQAVTALDSEQAPATFEYRSRPAYHPRRTAEPHLVGMRFIDCLFGRCRWPVDMSLDAPATSQSLCCGMPVGALESYCRSHQARQVKTKEAA
ncbi:MAG: GcrA cell cycle regulator [Mesorhizobium sp.]|uniref:GcrA family cell cycle regulator n=1 Tax=unclassified Mesorhizobium TaxID=325217 RepID=UPI000FCAE66A|nr:MULTISPECIES: GcrA family cell cycle regulator [unclassified Mesorhizobium]RUV65207.1 GcrA cell cycle regulator [Mesorhizobium sp. M5C.F.Ca.IN.020.29.1.1]TIM87647.1 MAG: GcrA cell cycle regulator [Mesorhizobium sp.]TIR33302.1 MAG: GcrA cell cycle regulator [Mesorhizobium sp.]